MEILLLGPLEVVADGHPVALPRGRARSLLALLALHPRQVMPTDRLLDELWGGEPPRTAVTALQGLVSTLRKRLEPGREADLPPTVLLTHAPGYVLAVDRDQVDVHRFRRVIKEAADTPPPERAARLRSALALWRGPPLADFTYEPFAQTSIASLEELRVAALEARIDADLALGRHVEVVAELEELVAAHPLREGLRAHLMLALYRCGRQREALHVYRAAHRELADELGLEPGPRLRGLEQAILRQDPSLDVPETVPVGVPAASSDAGAPWLGAGRRTVTVVFADLSVAGPSTSEVTAELSMASPPTSESSADPEAARPVLASAYATTREVVARHGGTVEGIVGDVAVAVFGLPVAHEDDPIRAVRAAAALRDDLAVLAVAAGDHGIHLATRVGIATGEIVVGDPAAASASGPTVGRAARLQQAARHGEVLLAETTRRLLQDAAVVEPVEDPSGVAVDGPVWRLVEIAAETAEPGPAGTSFVGRDEELARLRAAFERAVRARRAGLATVVGEAGLGKSRLAQALTESLADEARVATGHCRSYGEGVTFWPLRELAQDLTDGGGRAGLDRLLDGEPRGPSNAAQIAAATSLTDEHLQRPGDLFPAVRELFEVAARAAPLVAVIEDVHWAQPTFLELVEYLAGSVRAPVLLLCLARPDLYDMRPRWAVEVPAAVTVELKPLGAAESRQLVADRLGAARLLQSETIERILAMAQGNPLFLEQLLATVREDQEVAVPPSVQALLMARLDHLGPAERDLLRCASVIGVAVPLDALAEIVPDGTRPHLHRHLAALEDKQLIRRVDGARSGHPRFDFRHVLIQQAAYHSLTHAARADLHERLARWLETAAVAAADIDEVAGLHLERAVRHMRELGRSDTATDELAVGAGERLADAGLRAYSRFDVPAAANLLSRARALLPADHPQRPRVLRRLTEAYPVMGRPGDAAACFEELLGLVESDDDVAVRSVRLEQTRFRLMTGPDPVPLATIQHEVEDAMEVFRQAGEEVLVSQAHYVLASLHLRAGRIDALGEVAWRGIDRARRAGELRERLGAPWWVVLHLLEGPTPAPECIRACLEVVDVGELHHLGVVAALGQFRAMAGDPDEGRRLVARARDLLRERIRLPRPHSFIGQRRAAVELLAGDLSAAAAALEDALEVATRIIERDEVAQIAARLSLLRSRRGQANEAERLARLASQQAPSESVAAEALARTAEARALLERGEADRAERLVRQAVSGVPQDMLSLQALIHETLADVLEGAGREEDARIAIDRAVVLHERKGNVLGARAAAGSRAG